MKTNMIILVFVLLASNIPGLMQAQDKPKWHPPSELYLILPLPQHMYMLDNKETAQVSSFGLGLGGGVGNGEKFHTDFGLQFQRMSFNSRSRPDSKSFNIFDLLLGFGYLSPEVQNKNLRFTASMMGNLGWASDDFFLAPLVTAGLFYQLNNYSETPSGLNFTFYYRFTEIDISTIGGRLQPGLGFRIGYIIGGFYSRVE